MVAPLLHSSAAVELTFGGDMATPMVDLAVDGPAKLEARLCSPLARFTEVCESVDITPGLLAVAETVAGEEVEARHNARIGDAMFAQVAKEKMSEVKATLFERKKKQVHSAAAEAVAALESKVLAKQARLARVAMNRALSDPTKLGKRVRDRFGNRI